MSSEAGELDPKLEAALGFLRKHNTRFSKFHLPPEELGEEEPGHFHFGITDLSYEEIRKVLDREGCYREAVKALDPDDPDHGDMHYTNFQNQHDFLAALERIFLESTRTRIRNSIYGASMARGHGEPLGIYQKFYALMKRTCEG